MIITMKMVLAPLKMLEADYVVCSALVERR